MPPVRSLLRLTLLAALLALALAAPTFGAARMWVGFQDDPNLRWNEHKEVTRDQTVAEHATVLRTWVFWPYIAPEQPADPTDPFDDAYRFQDLDEFVRQAQSHGQEVLLTIWGVPGWANGDLGPNRMPTNVGDFQKFAYAVAKRYDGRHPGYPYVRFYSIWNEPNLAQFLSPQFAGKKDVSPGLYAKLYRAGAAGVRAASPTAFIGIGETSPRGHDEHTTNVQDSHSPGRFAELLAKQKPALKFDAWAHHPYVPPGVKPLAPQRYPNVTLGNLSLFETKLNAAFKRKAIPIWITEYAHETRPEDPKGVTYANQARYARQALQVAAKDPNVKMFVWFVLRDDPTSLWQSGFVRENGTLKPGFGAFANAALPLDARNPIYTVRAGVQPGELRFPVRELAVHMKGDERVGITYQVFDGNRRISVGQPDAPVGFDDWVGFRPIFTPARKHTYIIRVRANNIHGDAVNRTITILTK